MRGDAAVSDFVATLLLVALVVVLGSVLAVVVTANLDAPAAPAASFALASVSPGDATLGVVLRNGEAQPLGDLVLRVQRGAGPETVVPRDQWTTPDPTLLLAGERLALPLAPPAADGEAFVVRIVHSPANALLATLEARAGGADAALDPPTLAASFSPAATRTDAPPRLLVRVTHPAGGLAVARVVADVRNLTLNATLPAPLALGDQGGAGDLVGGDGTWTALVPLPARLPQGSYNVSVNATDVTGRVVATTLATLHVTGTRCVGCAVETGVAAYEGTRLYAPTSANLTTFRLRNWTWDRLHQDRLDDDEMAFRIVNATHAWSASLLFAEENGVAGIRTLTVWTAGNESTYAPRNGTLLPLAGLDLNLADPVAEMQMVHASGNAHPNSLYPRADMRGNTTLVVAYVRGGFGGGNPIARETALFSVDVVLS